MPRSAITVDEFIGHRSLVSDDARRANVGSIAAARCTARSNSAAAVGERQRLAVQTKRNLGARIGSSSGATASPWSDLTCVQRL